ncbi:MAG TPA: SRPBCC domain-containing protein [Thermoplasmata archaeon]|nr:SRPBCC domain-containing protein [Thermoplasmata archaeon]
MISRRDPGLTIAPDRSERILHKETTVGLPIERAWRAWTTTEGIGAWWVKQSWIELRVGGPFELYFAPDLPRGLQGSEACRILSYRPPEMLSFSWNFPPALPEIRSELT